jgi:nitroimidazol reductase NimA-like FMN-containing flavoprotein (pyridoxamine 5'-phosphate oxidase superfamily)
LRHGSDANQENQMTGNTKLQPKSEKNIAAYGLGPLSWDRALERLEQEWKLQPPPEYGGPPEAHTHWLATTGPDGRPHVVPVGAAWHEGAFYFTSGAGTRKSRDLARDPRCSIVLAAQGLDLTVEGSAVIIRDETRLRALAEVFAGGGWAPTVKDGAFHHEYSAPSAGPAPWDVYAFKPKTVYAFATAEPFGATRWRF